MNLTSLGILTASVMVGVVGAGTAYQLTSVDAPHQVSAPAPAVADPQAQPETRWAPCTPPALLEGNECVTQAIRTVMVPGEEAATIQPPVSAPAAVAGPDAPQGGQKGRDVGTHASEEAEDSRDHDTGRSNDDEADSAEDARDEAEDAAEDARDEAEDTAEDARDEAEDAGEDTEDDRDDD